MAAFNGGNSQSPTREGGDYVFMILNLPIKASIDYPNQWCLVKDLCRAALSRSETGDGSDAGSSGASLSRKLGMVHLHSDGGQTFATITVKEEVYARRLFHWIAGNSWHGHVLATILFYCSDRGERQVLDARRRNADPFPLERISPITNKALLRNRRGSIGGSGGGLHVMTPPMNANGAPRGQGHGRTPSHGGSGRHQASKDRNGPQGSSRAGPTTRSARSRHSRGHSRGNSLTFSEGWRGGNFAHGDGPRLDNFTQGEGPPPLIELAVPPWIAGAFDQVCPGSSPATLAQQPPMFNFVYGMPSGPPTPMGPPPSGSFMFSGSHPGVAATMPLASPPLYGVSQPLQAYMPAMKSGAEQYEAGLHLHIPTHGIEGNSAMASLASYPATPNYTSFNGAAVMPDLAGTAGNACVHPYGAHVGPYASAPAPASAPSSRGGSISTGSSASASTVSRPSSTSIGAYTKASGILNTGNSAGNGKSSVQGQASANSAATANSMASNAAVSAGSAVGVVAPSASMVFSPLSAPYVPTVQNGNGSGISDGHDIATEKVSSQAVSSSHPSSMMPEPQSSPEAIAVKLPRSSSHPADLKQKSSTSTPKGSSGPVIAHGSDDRLEDMLARTSLTGVSDKGGASSNHRESATATPPRRRQAKR